jgi:hypothetical protein
MTPQALTPFAKALVAMILSVWAHAAPGAEHAGAAGELARAIAFVEVSEAADGTAPVLTSHNEDAALVAYWAWRESSLNPGAVGDGGRSYGVLQQRGSWARTASLVAQVRAWKRLLRAGARQCRDAPRGRPAPASTLAWGACHAADTLTGRDVALLAAQREARARVLLVAALADLSAAHVEHEVDPGR